MLIKDFIKNNTDTVKNTTQVGKMLPSEYLFHGYSTNDVYAILKEYGKKNKIRGLSKPQMSLILKKLKDQNIVRPARVINKTLHYYSLGQIDELITLIREAHKENVFFYEYCVMKYRFTGSLGYLTDATLDPEYSDEAIDHIVHEIAVKSKPNRTLRFLQSLCLRHLSKIERLESKLGIKSGEEQESLSRNPDYKKLIAQRKGYATTVTKMKRHSNALYEGVVYYI